MLDVLDTLIVRETLERLPPTERRLAELLMAGSSPRPSNATSAGSEPPSETPTTTPCFVAAYRRRHEKKT